MERAEPSSQQPPNPINWESFYRDYRKPGYVPGYEIQVQLGSGAFGVVFKATKESIGKPYAIKFLKVDNVEVRQAVLRELDVVRHFAQVDHPNLVSIEDMGEVDGIPFIVMAFAGDDTLRRRIDAGALDRHAALAIFEQVCRGVQALHEHSLVHFDIKPANVYLKGDVARIGDYGLSKLVTDSRNSLSAGRGTPFYMAPELLRRKGDARSDIYALGVVLYEMLCGEPPFQGDSEWEVLRKHEEATVEFPTAIGDVERAAIEIALAKDPDARFQSVADMMAALAGETVPVAPVPKPRRDPHPRPRHARDDRPRRRGAGIAIFLLLAVAAFGALILFMLVAPAPSPTMTTTRIAPVRVPPARARFLEVAGRLPLEQRAQIDAIVDQLPAAVKRTDDAAHFAAQFTIVGHEYLHRIIFEIERLGTEDAMTWATLLRSKSGIGDGPLDIEQVTDEPILRNR